ncbi:MAG: hypothetical protein QNK37_35695 [Acidobacteriota bacterium]|nr:hypothetical protein [Acidobacteriota bacterium]
MLERLTEVKGQVVLSGYATPLYEFKLESWHRSTIDARSQNGEREEVLWSNREPPKKPEQESFVW